MWHLYPVRILDGRRREVYDRMRAEGIGVQVNYIPVYWHPVFEDLGYRRGMCPVAERSTPRSSRCRCSPGLTDGEVDRWSTTLTTVIALTRTRIGIVTQARIDSTRLPGKVLIEAAGARCSTTTSTGSRRRSRPSTSRPPNARRRPLARSRAGATWHRSSAAARSTS